MQRAKQVLRIEDGIMGRKAVIEIVCDRCGKVEHNPPGDDKVSNEPIFSGMFDGKRVEYRDLCFNCKEVVRAHWAEITKTMQKVSPTRDRKGASSDKPVAAAPPRLPAVGQKSDSHGTSQRS